MGTAFTFGIAVAICVVFPLAYWGIHFAADQIKVVMAGFVVVITIVGVLVIVSFYYREKILKWFKLRADKVLNDCITPAVATLESVLDGKRQEAIKHLKETVTVFLSWYSQRAAQRSVMALLLGLLAAFGALLGAALLSQQNALTVTQLQASTFLETSRMGRELMMKAWDDPQLRALVDPDTKKADPDTKKADTVDEKKIQHFLGVLIQHYATVYRLSKLGSFPKEVENEMEKDARRFFCSRPIKQRWQDVKGFYGEDVHKFADCK